MAGSDAVEELYRVRGYPPMSHPVSDPAVTAVAARFGGLETELPAGARILEIGCATGHNLLPLAVRWPGAEFTGCDISEEAVAMAKRRAGEAGIGNVRFIAGDIRGFSLPGEEFDYIIAHGVFSWVADDAKKALLDFCAGHLSARGIATVSFNLAQGWEARLPVVEAVRRICREHEVSVMRGLEILRELVADDGVKAIAEDMLAKGAEILDFDDFAPVNDPWPLDGFVRACSDAGLRWLGESDPAENFPSSLDEEGRASLGRFSGDPLGMQMAADALGNRTFRSGVLCRADAPVAERVSMAVVMDLSVRLAVDRPMPIDGRLTDFQDALEKLGAGCFPVRRVLEGIPERDVREMAGVVFHAITRGWLRARIEPVEIEAKPDVCKLDRFRMLCALERLPLVDAWHSPCLFSEAPYRLLERMDGRTVGEMAEISRSVCPDLAFPVWLEQVALRGLLGSR